MNLKASLLALAAAATLAGCCCLPSQSAARWQPLFDGKTLSGWSSVDPGDWKMNTEGVLTGKGPRSHLFSPETYTNFEFRAEIKLNHRGNSGMYFRAQRMPGWPRGYESQVENTSPDPQKTGSLYNFSRVTQQLIQDDTWWTQHIIAIGNRIIIKVNDKIVTDHVETKNSFTSGYLALQQHDPGSVVQYRNLKVKRLPDDPQAALAAAQKDTPELVAK